MFGQHADPALPCSSGGLPAVGMFRRVFFLPGRAVGLTMIAMHCTPSQSLSGPEFWDRWDLGFGPRCTWACYVTYCVGFRERVPKKPRHVHSPRWSTSCTRDFRIHTETKDIRWLRWALAPRGFLTGRWAGPRGRAEGVREAVPSQTLGCFLSASGLVAHSVPPPHPVHTALGVLGRCSNQLSGGPGPCCP